MVRTAAKALLFFAVSVFAGSGDSGAAGSVVVTAALTDGFAVDVGLPADTGVPGSPSDASDALAAGVCASPRSLMTPAVMIGDQHQASGSEAHQLVLCHGRLIGHKEASFVSKCRPTTERCWPQR